MAKITGNEPIDPMYCANGRLAGREEMGYIEGRGVFGLTIRQHFASMATPAAEDYSEATASKCVGRPFPGGDIVEQIKFWADFKAYLKVLEADALIAELNKSEE